MASQRPMTRETTRQGARAHAGAQSEERSGARGRGQASPPEPARRIARIRAHEHSVREREEFVPGALMVKCAEDVVANVPDMQLAHVATVRTLSLPEAAEAPFARLLRDRGIKEVIPVFSRLTRGRSLSIAPTTVAAAFATSVRDSENEDLRGINMLRLSVTENLEEVEKSLAATPGIEYVHRIPRRWMAATRPLPNDPMASKQWALRAIRWLKVDPTLDTSGVKVAILDTGVDLTHPELENMVKSYVHEGAVGVDVVGHGTHVAGTVTAEMGNGVGVAGVCQCDLSVWKIFSDAPDPGDGEYYVDDVMYQRALNAARNAGMRVLNLSIGGTSNNPTEAFLFRRLVSSGCTVVAAMGNEFDKGNPTEYPAAYPGIIAVGAITRANQRARFSNTGTHISLSAPGVGILSTLPLQPSAARKADETGYAFWDGTSMATPHVTAAAACVLARDPTLSPQQVGDRLTSTATRVATMGGKAFTQELGHGLLNLEKALS